MEKKIKQVYKLFERGKITAAQSRAALVKHAKASNKDAIDIVGLWIKVVTAREEWEKIKRLH